jgi:GDP-mannose 6-dehydrogenase
MKVAIFGLGYVGLTAACCIAHEGHQVIGIDVSEEKVRKIKAGVSPISEPGLEELLKKGVSAGLIKATTTSLGSIDDCDLAIVCVGTPSAPDGSHDMRFIADVTRQIAGAIKPNRTGRLSVAYRSTIRPGTVEDLITPIFKRALGEGWNQLVELIYNPEFLREASAISDYFDPPKIVVGTVDGRRSAVMDALHQKLSAPTFYVRFREAEITKFIDNCWHAAKVAFANEIGRVCMQLGISSEQVHSIFIADTKLNISPYYMRPGGAFGGSCLPKDVRAFQYISADCGAHTHLIDSVIRSNEAHKHQLFEHAKVGVPVGGKILVSGLAFKANSDDLRESPNVDLVRKLLNSGYVVSVYDPQIDAKKLVGSNLGFAYSNLPELETLLVSKDEAQEEHYDLAVITNSTFHDLELRETIKVVNLSALR